MKKVYITPLMKEANANSVQMICHSFDHADTKRRRRQTYYDDFYEDDEPADGGTFKDYLW